MATHSSILTWRIPGTGEPGGLPSMGSHRVGHDWSNLPAAAADFETVELVTCKGGFLTKFHPSAQIRFQIQMFSSWVLTHHSMSTSQNWLPTEWNAGQTEMVSKSMSLHRIQDQAQTASMGPTSCQPWSPCRCTQPSPHLLPQGTQCCPQTVEFTRSSSAPTLLHLELPLFSNCQHQLDHWKGKRVPEKHYFCFIDFAKAFDCVDRNQLWKIL